MIPGVLDTVCDVTESHIEVDVIPSFDSSLTENISEFDSIR